MYKTFASVGCGFALVLLGVVMGDCVAWPGASPDLRVKAVESGSVRVIVHLRVERMPDATVQRGELRRKAIAQAREAVFRQLASAAYRVTRVYATIPFVGLEVSPEALRVLEGSSLVLGVAEDTLSSTQQAPK